MKGGKLSEPRGVVGEKSRLQCTGVNRHEVENERVLQERSSEPPGPESCAATARDPAKRRQGIGGVGDRASKRCNPDADVFVMRGRQHERERERELLLSPA